MQEELSYDCNNCNWCMFPCSRLCQGNYRDICSASRTTEFSAERNVAECQFPGYISGDV